MIQDGYPKLAIDELRSLSSMPFEVNLNDKLVTFSLRIMSSNEASDEGYTWRSPILKGRGEYLAVFNGIVPYDLDELEASLREDGESSAEQVEELAASLVASDLDKLVGDLVLASAIALPGALHPSEVQCTLNGKEHSLREIGRGTIAEARAAFAKTGWPPLVNLPLPTTLAWLRGLPGFEVGVPIGHLGRAVAALSHLLSDAAEYGGPALMWTMIGLEALYTRGREGLSEQLREKTQVLLGVPESDAKRFKGLYDYRSKFIHGGLDVPLMYTPYDAVDAFMKSILDTYHAELTGIALLIATLQKMVTENRKDLKFHWVLESE